MSTTADHFFSSAGYGSSLSPKFTMEPRSQYVIVQNTVLILCWQIEHAFCTNIWYAEILEQNSSIIYRSVKKGLLSERDEYSVNANELPCENGTKTVNLTLSVQITDYILENVTSIYCRIQYNGTELINGKSVHLLKGTPYHGSSYKYG